MRIDHSESAENQVTAQQEHHLAGWRHVSITGMRGQRITAWRAVAVIRPARLRLGCTVGLILPGNWTADQVEIWVFRNQWFTGFVANYRTGEVFFFR